jgi:hypothetical protein
MELQELTGGNESGAVIFKETQEGFITNWSNINGIPRIMCDMFFVGLNDGDDIQSVSKNEVDQDLLEFALALANNHCIENNQEPDSEIRGVYENDEVLIVTFEGWC